jgi:hypothetical protein
MNKFLKINTLAAATAIIAALLGCSGQGNTQPQGGTEQRNEAQTQPPSGEDANQNSDAIDKVVKQQEQTQDNKESGDEPLSAETVKQAYSTPSELQYYKQSDEYLFQKFYPIGWSKDGNFAYVIEPADEAAGLYFFKLKVQNMISDKDVYSWEPDEDPETGSIKQMWKDNQMTFAAKLNELKIIPQNDIKLLGTEFSTEEGKFKVTIENTMETDPDFGFEVVKSTNIYIKSAELGTKRIYSYTEKDYNQCLGRIVQGVIKSPYEKRIAVLVKEELRGYEGPPNVVREFLVGADLERNFKKK